MTEYIYIVKCDGCEDEMFNFFTDARMQCDLVMSKHPTISQIEIKRNDFGECTDHCDLGTVWSWEDLMDTKTEDTPAISIFTKDDLKCMADGKDPEFVNIDNSVDFEIEKVSDTDFIKEELKLATNKNGDYLVKADSGHGYTVFNRSDVAIGGFGGDDDAFAVRRFEVGDINESCKEDRVIAGKTPEELVEAMEENEDIVECKTCFNLFPKVDCTKDDRGYICTNCANTATSIPTFPTFDSDILVDEAIADLIIDEVEAIDGYDAADEVVQHAKIPEARRAQIISILDHIKKEEKEHIEELKELSIPVDTSHTASKDFVALREDEDEPNIDEDTVECTWCNDLFDKSECRYEVDLGWLCSRCEMAIKSRGETLTFRENNYWDFLDEKLDIGDIDFSNCIDSSDMEIWGIEPVGESIYKAVLLKRYEDVPFRGAGYRDEIEKVESEMFDLGGLFVFHFGKDGLPKLGRWDPELLNSLGNCEIIFDDERYDRAVEETLNGSASKREDLDPETLHDLGNEYDGGYPTEKPDITEISEVSDAHLVLCPECGTNSFDTETGICINCGFN